MKHLAAYLLLRLAGKTPNEGSIKSLLDTVGVETDNERLKQLLGELKDKDIEELINSGLSKLSSVPTGGGAVSSGGAAAGADATAEAAPAEEAKKEEEKEESDEDMGFGLFD